MAHTNGRVKLQRAYASVVHPGRPQNAYTQSVASLEITDNLWENDKPPQEAQGI